MARVRTTLVMALLVAGAVTGWSTPSAAATSTSSRGPAELVDGLTQCAGLAVLFPDLFVSCSVGVVANEAAAGVDAAGAVAQCAGLAVVLPELFVECVVGVVT